MFTEEEIEKANKVDIVKLLEQKGYPIKKLSKKTCKISEHDGFVIDTTKNSWNWFSASKGGGPIQLLMELEGKAWKDVVEELIENKYEIIDGQGYINAYRNDDKGVFSLPDKKLDPSLVIGYLSKHRCISYEIITKYIRKGSLYQDIRNNCVFVGYDEIGNARSAFQRGTIITNPFKGSVRNSNNSYTFSNKGTNQTLRIFESPIDLMSFESISLKETGKLVEDHLLSTNGLNKKAIKTYLEINEINEIVFCFDNDEAGINFTNYIKGYIESKFSQKYIFKIEQSNNKDFNEDLQIMCGKKAKIK